MTTPPAIKIHHLPLLSVYLSVCIWTYLFVHVPPSFHILSLYISVCVYVLIINLNNILVTNSNKC